jgi:DNA polymerase-3 subunit beta
MLELKVTRDELLKGVSKTQSIAEKRSSMPILSNILIDAQNDQLLITATDLEISFKGTFAAEVKKSGRLTVPARKLYEIIHEMSDEALVLKELDNYNLEVSSARSNYQLHGLSAEDFPPMPDYESVTFLDIPAETLSDMIEKTIYSISTEETRYNLSGVCVERIPDEESPKLRFVSTDGHRLSLMDAPIPGLDRLGMTGRVIISRKGLMEMKKLADEGNDLKLGFTGNSAVVIKDTSVLVIRLLEGRFPDYNLVIPKDNPAIMTLGRKDFLEAMRRISTMLSDRYKGARFDIETKNLTITVVNPDVGEATENLPVEFTGDGISAGFNVKYFIEILSPLKADAVQVVLKDAKSPCLIKSEEDRGFLGVIMPMNL